MRKSSVLRRILSGLLVLACLVPSLSAGAAHAQRVQQSVTLQFWTPLFDSLSKSLLLPYFRQFEKKYPFITVRFVGVPQDQNGGWTKYTTAMAAGRGPDVILTTGFNPPVPEWAADGFIQPLDPWFKQLGVSQNKWLPWVWKMQYYHGRIWDFVQEYDTLLFVWNKDVFRKAGLNPNQPPRTIAQLDADAQKLTKFDKRGNLVQAGFVPWQSNAGSYEMRLWPTMFGGSVYDQARGRYTLDTPANVRAFAWLGKYAKMLGGAEKVSGLLGKFTGNADPIYTGQVAMEVVGDWFPTAVYKAYAPKNFHYGVAAIPTAPGVPYGTDIVIGSDTFAMPAGTKHPKEAAELMLYMMGNAPVLAWCIGESNVPPTRSAVFSQRYLSGVPFMSVAVKTARMALDNPKVLSPFPSSSIYDYVTMQEGNAEQEVEYGRKSAKAALDELQKLADQREAKAKQENPTWYHNGD